MLFQLEGCLNMFEKCRNISAIFVGPSKSGWAGKLKIEHRIDGATIVEAAQNTGTSTPGRTVMLPSLLCPYPNGISLSGSFANRVDHHMDRWSVTTYP